MSNQAKCKVEGVFYQGGMTGVCRHSKQGGLCGLDSDCEYKIDAENKSQPAKSSIEQEQTT